ncbi:MAG: acetyltransferase-like isoleucine patch superfamily enzyme [Bacteroidia bacterium]|jgi:acetyltransferase-like isoleucine patch superfamily enzyme
MDGLVFKSIMRLAYPQFQNLYPNDVYYFQLFKRYFFFQKILRINGSVPWPVDFRSQIINWKLIEKSKSSYPGGSMGCYINASGGLKIGKNVIIGPNTIIATTNHSKSDHTKTSALKGVTIGDRVWIGANCSIVPGANIGNDVTVGAGCYIKTTVLASSIVRRVEGAQEIVPKKASHEDEKTS